MTSIPLNAGSGMLALQGAAGADGSAQTAPAPAADAAYRARAEAAAEKFEAFFISEMLKQMRRAGSELAPEDSVFKSKVNQDMLDLTDNLMGDNLAGQRAFGIADAILRQLLPENGAANAGFKVSSTPVALRRQGEEAGKASPSREP